MVEIRFTCSTASSAAFSCAQRPCRLRIIEAALQRLLVHIGKSDLTFALKLPKCEPLRGLFAYGRTEYMLMLQPSCLLDGRRL
jgi:hypothetical protein